MHHVVTIMYFVECIPRPSEWNIIVRKNIVGHLIFQAFGSNMSNRCFLALTMVIMFNGFTVMCFAIDLSVSF